MLVYFVQIICACQFQLTLLRANEEAESLLLFRLAECCCAGAHISAQRGPHDNTQTQTCYFHNNFHNENVQCQPVRSPHRSEYSSVLVVWDGDSVVCYCLSGRRVWIWFRAWRVSGWSLHVLHVPAWVLFRYPGFLPQFKDMHNRWSEESKLPIRVNVSVCALFVSICWPCDRLTACPGDSRPCPNCQLWLAVILHR